MDDYLKSTLLQGVTPVITQDTYESTWKPAGWRLLIIGPTSTWRTEWGAWEAIRDIVQNCLDETETYQSGYDADGLWIGDKGKGVAVEDFLLGPPKLKPDWARGKYGEGMKIASLALLRKGHPIYVQTVNKDIWVCFVEQRTNGRIEQLAALWKPNGSRSGTRFHIVGYQDTNYPENFTVNLPRSLVLAEAPSFITTPKQRYNQLLRAEGMARGPKWSAGIYFGRIYCRDIWLEDTKSPFSYNLWDLELAPDRHGPKNQADLYEAMGRLWMTISNVALLKTLLPYIVDPVRSKYVSEESVNLTMLLWGPGDPVQKKPYGGIMLEKQKEWQSAWDAVVGPQTVLRTSPRFDGMVAHLGYTSQSVQFRVRDAMQMVIKTDEELVREMAEKLSKAQRVPDSKLAPRQCANLNLAKFIADDFDGMGKVYAAIIPPASDAVERTAGMYEFDTSTIMIDAELLESPMKTVGVMVHELGHHVAYMNTGRKSIEEAADLTRGHALGMEHVAGRIFVHLGEGFYDEAIAEPDFRW